MAGRATGEAGGRPGQAAASPREIPAAGWRETLWRVYSEIGEDRVMLVAAGVTYYLLLALVPGLTALVSLYGLFADPATMGDHLAALEGFVPAGGMELLREQLGRLASSRDGTLGLAFAVSLLVALWSANAGVKALFEAMNVAYDEREARGFLKLNAVSLLFTLCLILGALVLIGTAVVLPVVLSYLPIGDGLEWAVGIGAGLVTLLALSLGVAALYRWGPSRQKARWRWITPGAVLTLLATAIVSAGFTFYAANFGSYDATYGSLGALIGFMTWIWLTMIVLIVGAEMNAELEHQTARDSTTGPERALGSRGAVMADRVADGTDPERDAVDRSQGGAHRDGPSGSRRSARRPDTGAQPAEPLSVGRLALALPAALALGWALGRRR